jgi:hypothetical protein
MGNKLIILFLLLNACKEHTSLKRHDFQNDLNRFKDIDIYNFKGIYAAKDSSSYPYIEIKQINDSIRNVIFHDPHYYPERDSHTFKKEKNYWVARSTSDIDTCGNITYEYILPNKLVYLYYCQGPSMKDSLLMSVALFEDSVNTEYNLGDGFKWLPGLDVIPLARQKCKGVCITYNKVENGTLTINRQCFDEKQRILSNDIDCYAYNGYTNYWWRHFRWTQKKIACKFEKPK